MSLLSERGPRAQPDEADEASPSPLRRNRNYRLLWVGGTVSSLGSRASAFAYPLLVLALGHSAADAAAVGAAATLPYLVVPTLVAPLVDRVDRRRAMLLADGGRLLTLCLLVGAVVAGRGSALAFVVLAALEGALAVVHGLAEPAAMRRAVPPEQLTDALSGSEARARAGLLLGQPVGGALFGITRILPFVVDIATYAVSLATTLLLRGDFRPDPVAPTADEARPVRRAVGELAAGMRWLWTQPFLRAAVLAIATSNLLFQALSLVIVVRARDHGASPTVIGLLFLGSGLGGVLGTFAAGWVSRHVPVGRQVIGINWVWALLTPAVVLAGNPWVMGAVFAAMSFCGPLWNISVAGHQMAVTPEHLMSRVGGAIGTLALGALPVGSALGGLLLSRPDPALAAWVLGGLMLAVALLVTVSPSVRAAGRTTSDDSSQPSDPRNA